MSDFASLDAFLERAEPSASFHDAELVSLSIDYEHGELSSEWHLFVGDPDAPDEAERERTRQGRLRLTGLVFWVVEPPEAPLGGGGRKLPWLTSDGPLLEAKTPMAATLAQIVPPAASAWYLYFSDWNAFAYCAAVDGDFEWTS